MDKKADGDFLVRKSEENAGDRRSFVLSVRAGGKTKHFIFREQRGKLAVDMAKKKTFKTIREFIAYYRDSADSVCSVRTLLSFGN